MKKLLVVGLIGLVCACVGTGKSAEQDQLNAAIRETSDYLNKNIPAGNKLAILNMQSDFPLLSEYIIDELIANAVNDRVFTVVDRERLDAIRAELDFQMSGEVDDSSAQELGRMLGAETIVLGGVSIMGDMYRLRVRALNVQSARIEGQFNRNIPDGPSIAMLVKNPAAGNASPAAGPAGAQQTGSGQTSAASARAYKIGDTGPAGGLIFYDKGDNSDGWRYLEAAPLEAEFQAKWSIRGINADDTKAVIGSGRRNTQFIVEALSKATGEWDTAAQKCDELVFGGFDDWFLPSRDELDQMYGNLKRRNLGDFKDRRYWSSSQYSSRRYIFNQNFETGSIKAEFDYSDYYVRPIRQVPGPSQ